jgi:tubulin polyglutamylase TTLL9
MSEHQRVNHFANHVELTRKDLMAKNINRAKRQASKTRGADGAKAFDILPLTYVMPQEALMMKRAFKDHGGLWIMKPIGRAQGKGIFVVHKLSQINKWLLEREKNGAENICIDNYVAQQYISAPYCVGGRKFDIRLYVLVVSYRPLRAYLYREGFARFTAAQYTCDKDSLNDNMVHLTNHAVQKKDANYDAAKCDLRWSVRSMRQYIAARHGTDVADGVIVRITNLIIHSLLSVAPVIIHDRHCFELYGYDVMLDADLRPWLIEVNASPSMSVDSASDRALKTALFHDVLNVVDMEQQYHRADDRDAQLQTTTTPRRVGGFDLIYDQVVIEENLRLLGGLNDDREDVLARARKQNSVQSS